MSVRVKRCAALLAAVVVAAAAAGVGTAIANKTGDQGGRIADVAVHRTVLRDVTGAVVSVIATASLAPRSHAAALARVAPASATAYRGDGRLRLGRLILPAGARVTWALSGRHRGRFSVRAAGAAGPGLAISSRAPRGSMRIPAGAYRDVVVGAAGRWTLLIRWA